ncbi:MgtC/SapB family protein [Methylocystis parvus]|uniref:MgtC/SapB family protein n=1 Tax=Methylocystis parvus TaxID=134 RepID=A0A6B8M428_9HYPH|nr:MgtC/SapB family protein [Methylocystis parvus]QGM96499.1 MgtC/SapB family protein [Methylocystis parvus]WBJ99651.1 MgtC/SapB family protein [Methylocystis parvus OBBP]
MYEMSTAELIQRLSVALAIGLLIGLERGWRSREEQEGERAAGLRTHGLAALLGGVWGAVAMQFAHDGGAIALGLAFALFGAVMAFFRYREIVHNQSFGATTLVGVLLAFALGAFAVVGDRVAAAAAAVAATALLALKALLHGWVQRLTWVELRSALVLLAMSFILLPVLPNQPIDRWGAINPHELWLMTVLIGVVSFAGYVAVRLVGYRRGVAVAGMAGGLASSTVATAAMSRLAADQQEQADALAAGAIFANTVMAPRVLAILGLVNPEFALRLVAPLLAVGLVYLAVGVFFMWRSAERATGDGSPLTVSNPLDLPAVLKFGALLSAVMILAKIVTKFAGSAGAYALALLSGIADVDAISLAMASQGVTTIGAGAAALSVLLAILANTIVKSGIAWAIGGWGIGWRFSLASALSLAAGLAALVFIPVPPGV